MFKRVKNLYVGIDVGTDEESFVEISEPHFVNESEENCEEEELHSFEDMDRMFLNECGYSEESPRYKKIFENVVADSDDEKIFTIDKYRSYGLEDTVNEILKDETFDNYWHKNIYDRLDDEADSKLLEQWTPEFMGEEVRKYLSKLNKIEKFYYIEFFREILSKSDNDDAVNLIDFNDPVFDEMPNVMRLY